MAYATGVAKQLTYKAESTWGTVPAASSAQALRRVTSNLALKKQTYQSNEIRPDYQVSDMRHGVRSVEGSISGELSPGTYEDFMAAAVRKTFTALSAITGLSLTIATSGSYYTITRASGDFVSGGVRIGDVIRITAGSVNANNLNKNCLVIALTTTVATVHVLNGLTMTAEGPIASCSVTVVGKKAIVPASSHTDTSFSIEHWQSDIAKSDVFSGCKVNTMSVQLPATGIAGIEFGFMGKDVVTADAQYFTTPTAATTSGVVAAVNGAVIVNGARVANLTSMNFSVNGGMSAEPVVGSNSYPDIFEGRVTVSGQITAFFEDHTYFDLFDAESEVAIACAFTTSSAKDSDFVSFVFPRVKFGSADRDDGEKGIVQTLSFTALYNGAGTTSDVTTFAIQDSLA